MLLVDPIPAAAQLKFRAAGVQVGNLLLHRFGFLAFFQLEHSFSIPSRSGLSCLSPEPLQILISWKQNGCDLLHSWMPGGGRAASALTRSF